MSTYGREYSDEEKRSFIKPLFQNIFMDMQNLIKAMDILKIDYENPSSAVSQLYLEEDNNEIIQIGI